jgi:hypothetical protein
VIENKSIVTFLGSYRQAWVRYRPSDKRSHRNFFPEEVF